MPMNVIEYKITYAIKYYNLSYIDRPNSILREEGVENRKFELKNIYLWKWVII